MDSFCKHMLEPYVLNREEGEQQDCTFIPHKESPRTISVSSSLYPNLLSSSHACHEKVTYVPEKQQKIPQNSIVFPPMPPST